MQNNKMYKRLLVVAFVYYMGANMLHPVTPTLMQKLGLADHMFGVLFAVMSVGYLLGSVVCGRLCDRFGRLVIFTIGMVGYGVWQMVFGLSFDQTWMLIARFFAGLFASGLAVALMAMIVDMTEMRSRAAHLSVYTAVMSISTAIGYFAGGMLGASDFRVSVYAQGVMIFGEAALGVILLHGVDKLRKETQNVEVPSEKLTKREVLQMLGLPMLLFLLGVTFANFATYGFDNSFNYYLKGELDFNSSVNGIVKATTGLIGLMANLFINRWILHHFEQNKALSCILILCAGALLVVTQLTSITMFFLASIVYYLFNALYQPIQQSLSARGEMRNIGLISGFFYAARAVGMIFGPLTAGYLYEVGARVPFYLAAVAFSLAGTFTYLSYACAQRKSGAVAK